MLPHWIYSGYHDNHIYWCVPDYTSQHSLLKSTAVIIQTMFSHVCIGEHSDMRTVIYEDCRLVTKLSKASHFHAILWNKGWWLSYQKKCNRTEHLTCACLLNTTLGTNGPNIRQWRKRQRSQADYHKFPASKKEIRICSLGLLWISWKQTWSYLICNKMDSSWLHFEFFKHNIVIRGTYFYFYYFHFKTFISIVTYVQDVNTSTGATLLFSLTQQTGTPPVTMVTVHIKDLLQNA